MYQLGGVFQETAVGPGTNILIEGPPMTGKYSLALDLLAAGSDAGEGSIIVTTKDGADRIRSQFSDHVETGSGPLGIVDCLSLIHI